MEANTTSYTLLSILKWLFPSLFGSVLAVWYKRNDIDWKNKTLTDKIIYSMFGLIAIIVGCTLGVVIGNTIIVYTEITEDWYKFSVLFVSGLCSLKVLDSIVKNSDDVLKIISDGIKESLMKFFDRFGGR